ncbi:MAG: hypothetical protein NTW21_22410 [Verrucomicrobia bacterium]|nr:hypothetical protein [Verrucomicrobiota bacterium]
MKSPPTQAWHILTVVATAAAWLAGPALADGQAGLPEGFTIPQSTLSPDGRHGVLVPDPTRYQENNGNRLVDAATGQEEAVIRARTGVEHANHVGIYPRWTEDGSGLLWLVSDKWFPRAMVYLRIADGKVQWQRDLLTLSQQEILKRVRKADPVAYAAAVKENKSPGTVLPEGFTINVNTVGSEVGLPLHFNVDLTSDPQHLNCPPGGKTLSGRIYEPPLAERKPFDAMPQGELVEARMRGVLAADGTITWSGFRVATGAKAVQWYQYLYGGKGGEWRGDLPEDFVAKFREAVPEALAEVQAYAREHPAERCWSIVLMAEPRAPDSLAVDFLMLIDSNSPGSKDPGNPNWRERENFPQAGEIVASLGGSLEEDGTVKWGKLDVATGAEAVRRRAAMKRDDSVRSKAEPEIQRRVEAAAPETMAALQTFAATQPKQDAVFSVDFDRTRLSDRHHPGVRPAVFVVTLEPAYIDSRQVRLPLEAEFQARLEGTLQADGTLVWGGFTFLHGEAARKARRDRDAALNRAGWPAFLGP